MTERCRRYTPEEDEAIRAMDELPRRSRERAAACADIAARFDRTGDAIASRARILAQRRGGPQPRHRNRAPFSAEEDAMILAMPTRPKHRDWQRLGARLDRPILTMKHRRLALIEVKERARRPDLDARFRTRLPVSQPAWFESRITRDRLMAGR